MSHFNELAEQMGAGDSDLIECRFCGRASCEGDCYEVRRYVREYAAANARRLLTSPVGPDSGALP